MCRPLCEDRSNVGRQLYFFKIAARSALRSTLHTAERLVAASEEGMRDVALQQREPRSGKEVTLLLNFVSLLCCCLLFFLLLFLSVLLAAKRT